MMNMASEKNESRIKKCANPVHFIIEILFLKNIDDLVNFAEISHLSLKALFYHYKKSF